VIDLFIQGSIANAAHISGLLTGVFFGGLMVFIDRKSNDKHLNS
jgi:membrane associated rhomboid family serine protease